MPAQPLDIVRNELSQSAREYEYLDLGDTSVWSDADKQAAADELMRAGENGDARVPAALVGLLPSAQLTHSWEYLLEHAPAAVAVEAGWQLLEQGSRSFASAPFVAALRRGEIYGHGLTRAVDLLIAAKHRPLLDELFTSTTDEDVRAKIAERTSGSS